MTLGKDFWNDRYINEQTFWDVGEITTPLKQYFDQLTDKNVSILIPGCGNAHEARYLMDKGFTHVTLVDISDVAVKKLQDQFAGEISKGAMKIICCDFFDLNETFDLIIEQTFFCAIDPEWRMRYAEKMKELLKPEGVLAGLLFDTDFEGGPPFGGQRDEYLSYFTGKFNIKIMEPCYNSIEKRKGRELFMMLEKT